MIKEGGIGREDMLACPDLKVIARHGVGFATVDAKGNVKAIRKGSTVITVKLYNGKKARLKLTVK